MKFFLPIAWLMLCLGVSTAMAANPAGELRVDDSAPAREFVRLKFLGVRAGKTESTFGVLDRADHRVIECRIGDKIGSYTVAAFDVRQDALFLKDARGQKLRLSAAFADEPWLMLVSTNGKARFNLRQGDIFKFNQHLYQVINYDWPKRARILDTASQQEFVLTSQGPPAAEGK